MRCFLAIELDDQLKERLWELIDRWRPLKAPVKWVERENLHLTIKFLGQFPDDQIESLSQQLRDACLSLRPFLFYLEGTGVFPDWKRPRVLWVGVKDGEPLKLVHRTVEDITSRFGAEREERPFHPHITIGRVREPYGVQSLMEEVRKLRDESFGAVRADHLSLFESRLTGQGPIYRLIAQFPFGNE